MRKIDHAGNESLEAIIHIRSTMAEEEAALPPAQEVLPASPSKKRAFIPLAQKIDLCIEAERVVRAEKKKSLKGFCRENNIQPSQLRRWTKNLIPMKQALEACTNKRTRLVCSNGRRSKLWEMKDKLLHFVEAKQSVGHKLSIRQVAIEAKRHDRSLCRMKRYSLFAMVRRFCYSHGVVMRTPTHRSQEDPREKVQVATAFLQSTIPRIHQGNRHPAFIINMDQTPYNPKETANRTLAKRGSKTVNGKEIKTSVGRITGCLAVCADGTKLPPLLVYKAKPTGSVVREVKTYCKGALYTVQENAWCDEAVMLFWVENVLRPYVKNAPEGIVPYLLLDKYTCHYQGSVARAIEELGVEWDILPGGCTGLIQPVDVGINRPWKNRLRYKVEDFIMEQDNFTRLAPKTMRPLMAQWAVASWDKVQKQTVYNSWRHKPFSYFPDEETCKVTFQDDNFDYASGDSEEEEEEEEDSSSV